MLLGTVFREESVSGIPGPDFLHFRTENDTPYEKIVKSKMEAKIAAKTLQKPEVEKKSPH